LLPVAVVAKIVDVPKGWRTDADDDDAAVRVGLAGNIEQAVYEVEHCAVLGVERRTGSSFNSIGQLEIPETELEDLLQKVVTPVR